MQLSCFLDYNFFRVKEYSCFLICFVPYINHYSMLYSSWPISSCLLLANLNGQLCPKLLFALTWCMWIFLFSLPKLPELSSCLSFCLRAKDFMCFMFWAQKRVGRLELGFGHLVIKESELFECSQVLLCMYCSGSLHLVMAVFSFQRRESWNLKYFSHFSWSPQCLPLCFQRIMLGIEFPHLPHHCPAAVSSTP